MSTHITKLGFTFEYFIPGVLLIIIGGISFFANSIIASLLLFVGICLLLLRTGIEIDPTKKRVRKFYDLFFVRFGSWINAVHTQRVELHRTHETQTMRSRVGETTYDIKTYDIVFIDKYGSLRELNDFKSYNKAVQVMNMISELLGLETKNEVLEIRNAALKRRKDTNHRK